MDEPTPNSWTVLARGAAGGALAWLAGYLVTYVLYADRIDDRIGTEVLSFLAGGDVTWKLVGWLFYNAHYASVRVPGLFGDASRNFVSGADELGVLALLVLPPVLLAFAGALAARGITDASAVGARNGAAVALGYLPLSVAGISLFSVSGGGATAQPEGTAAALLAGLVYPVAFGGLGGALGTLRGGSSGGE